MASGLKKGLKAPSVSIPSAPGGLGFSDKGCFPSLSMKQRVTYFGYSFIGGNVCITLVRAAGCCSSCTASSRRRASLLITG